MQHHSVSLPRNSQGAIVQSVLSEPYDPTEWEPDEAWDRGVTACYCAKCTGPITAARFEEFGVCPECAAESRADFYAGMDPDNLAGLDSEEVG